MNDASPPVLAAQMLRYDSAAKRIEDEIRNGALIVGSRLLGERDLSRVLGVSRVTVRRALGELRLRGVVTPDEQRGWFVAETAVSERNILRSFTDLARLRGLEPGSRVLAAGSRAATITEAEVFGLKDGEPVFEVTRLRLMACEPITIETSRVPLHLCPLLAETDFGVASLHATLGEAGFRPVRADYALTAANADPAQARLLGVPPGAALLVSESVARDARGRVVEVSRALFRADRYVFNTTLRAP